MAGPLHGTWMGQKRHRLAGCSRAPYQMSLGDSWLGEGRQEVSLKRFTLESKLEALGEVLATNVTFLTNEKILSILLPQ